jgi:hypothetical protein
MLTLQLIAGSLARMGTGIGLLDSHMSYISAALRHSGSSSSDSWHMPSRMEGVQSSRFLLASYVLAACISSNSSSVTHIAMACMQSCGGSGDCGAGVSRGVEFESCDLTLLTARCSNIRATRRQMHNPL